jgi:uncharacterized protein
VVIESTDVLDQSAMMTALDGNPELTMFTDATTLRSLIPADDIADGGGALRQRGMPLSSINKMKPWMVSALIALPACEFDRKAAGKPILDIMLARQAEAAGQAPGDWRPWSTSLAPWPRCRWICTSRGWWRPCAWATGSTMCSKPWSLLYLPRNASACSGPSSGRCCPPVRDGEAGYVVFEETMVTMRATAPWPKDPRPILQRGGAFIAVGALHLPGPEGLVELLREAGYEVTPEPL